MNKSLEEGIAVLLERSAKLMQEARTAAVYKEAGVTWQQWKIIAALAGGKEISLMQLRSDNETTKQNLSAIIDRMRKNGLIETKSDGGDKRGLAAKLTEKGEEKAKLADGMQNGVAQEMTERLRAEEKLVLFGALEKVCDRLRGMETLGKDSGAFASYLDKIDKIGQFNAEETESLIKQAKTDDDAKRDLFWAQLRRVADIAEGYETKLLSALDIINEGNIGIIEAFKRIGEERAEEFWALVDEEARAAIEKAIAQKEKAIADFWKRNPPTTMNAERMKEKEQQNENE